MIYPSSWQKRWPKFTQGYPRLDAVPWDWRHFNELSCGSKSRNAVPWACMQVLSYMKYSGEDKTSVEYSGGDFSINNAFYPKNLGAKWKLFISRFQNSSWMLDFELNWPRYDWKNKPNFSLKFMFLSYSYRFRSIDSFETFYNSSWVQFFCHISVNLAPNVTSRESFGI